MTPQDQSRALGLLFGLTSAALAVTGCGTGSPSDTAAGGRPEAALSAHRCLTTVHEVVPGPGAGTISLPIVPGPVIARKAAVAAARRSERAAWRHAVAKLSSWTETATMLAAQTGHDVAAAPAALRGGWRPVWAVLLTGPAKPTSSPGRSSLVVVDAATGKPVFTAAADARRPWFAALTDRDPAAGGNQCPGGSSARLPFGVLTRAEEAYAAGVGSITGSGGDRASTRVVLSTVPAVNKADPSMYGGCIQQNCSIDELVWVEIRTDRAGPGRTLPCLPPSASYPPGFRARKVKQTFSVNVPDNGEIGCGPVPGPIARLTDLAPPARG